MGREVRRVPLGFDWPLNKVWQGYLMPDELALPNCLVCEVDDGWGHRSSDGYSPEAREIANMFYPHQIAWAPRELAEQLAWHDKITQDEVDYLAEKDRLHAWNLLDRIELQPPYELDEDGDPIRFRWVRNDRPVPTADEVNKIQRTSPLFGHDAINRMYLIEYRCRKAGIETRCANCGGKGHVAAYEAWERSDPPTGEGWQMWETVSEGSPVSPVFATADALAAWMSDPERGRDWMPAETAAKFITEGWAPTLVGTPETGIVSGAEFIGFHSTSEE